MVRSGAAAAAVYDLSTTISVAISTSFLASVNDSYFAPLPAGPVFPISTIDTLSSMHNGSLSVYTACVTGTSCCHGQTNNNERMSVCHDRYLKQRKGFGTKGSTGILR